MVPAGRTRPARAIDRARDAAPTAPDVPVRGEPGSAGSLRLTKSALLSDERLRLASLPLYLEVDFIGAYFAGVFQIEAIAEFQVDRERNVVAMDFAFLNRLFELISAHGSRELVSIGF